MRKWLVLGALTSLMLATGCQTVERGVLSIPSTRDYGNLPEATVEDAVTAVDNARRAGAAHSSPYEFYSAEQYLSLAQQQKDRKSRQDYAQLARTMAEAALRGGTPMAATAESYTFEDETSVRTAFDGLLNRYEALDRDKAKIVAPVLLARVTAGLSKAEHDFGGRDGWKGAARTLQNVSSYLDTLVWQDSDGDGVADMVDAAPLLAEDKDGFEDEDGSPDLDNDGDGVPDTIDARPMEPETRNRWHDEDGLPDEYPTLDSVYFAPGSTALSSDAKGYLKSIRYMLDEWPDLRLHIRGYADNLHSETYGMEMSQRRAEEVRRYLTLLGVAADRIETTYHGQAAEASPEEATATGAVNDRVELAFE